MAPRSIALFLPHHQTFGYKALEGAPYTDDADDSALANNLLCPRYAENDTSSAPPSPASIESFDVLDSVAWRRGHAYAYGWASHGAEGKARNWNCDAVRKRWRKNRAHIIALLLVFLLLVLGCVLGAVFALRYEGDRTVGVCLERGGAERCVESAWAQCIARNGVGYCEGVL